MPVHDWTRVSAGTFHDFHCGWAPEIRTVLNNGLLPPDYYAQVEQVAKAGNPDMLTLHTTTTNEPLDGIESDGDAGTMTATAAPPRVRVTATLERAIYARKRRRVVIRHSSGDQVVAFLEVLSPGNKSSHYALRKLVLKIAGAVERGYHVLLIDLFPPTRRDPQGIHGAVWADLGDESYVQPGDKPLTLASYSAGEMATAYVEPIAVGDVLPDMPLFLDADTYVNVPLEATYQAAYRGLPQRWRRVLEG